MAVVVITSVNCESQDLKLPRMWPRFDGTHCETTKAELDLLAERSPQDTAIIIIARLGTGEYSSTLNRRRLEGMREYLQMTWLIAAASTPPLGGFRLSHFARTC